MKKLAQTGSAVKPEPLKAEKGREGSVGELLGQTESLKLSR